MPDVSAIAAKLRFTTDKATVKANTEIVLAALNENRAERTALLGLMEACYSLCGHLSRTYLGDGDWSCNDCGKSS